MVDPQSPQRLQLCKRRQIRNRLRANRQRFKRGEISEIVKAFDAAAAGDFGAIRQRIVNLVHK